MEFELINKTLPTFFKKEPIFETFNMSEIHHLEKSPIKALHYHKFVELGICISGEGETYIENRLYRYKSGDIQVIPAFVPHLSKSDNNKDTCWRWITFVPKKVLMEAGIIDTSKTSQLLSEALICGVYTPEEYPELTEVFSEILKEGLSDSSHKSLAIALAICKLLIVSDRIKRSGKELDKKIDADYGKIAPVIEFISSNLDSNEKLSEQNLADIINVSVSTLRRLFYSYTGFNPKEFIVRSRMANAENLLRKTDLTVVDVAERVGYNEPSGFNRTFRRYFNTSPAQYRKNNI